MAQSRDRDRVVLGDFINVVEIGKHRRTAAIANADTHVCHVVVSIDKQVYRAVTRAELQGNQAEVHTLEQNVAACRQLGLKSVTMVFDRGLVSKKNLKMLTADKQSKFISALDKPQIP